MLIDKSEGGSSTIISGLSLCRDKQWNLLCAMWTEEKKGDDFINED
jgi:hypothetical protein